MTTGGDITEKIKKITPRPFLHGISFHLAEHCNLNCFSCDNFSQIAKKGYYELNQFEKDVQKNISHYRRNGRTVLFSRRGAFDE